MGSPNESEYAKYLARTGMPPDEAAAKASQAFSETSHQLPDTSSEHPQQPLTTPLGSPNPDFGGGPDGLADPGRI